MTDATRLIPNLGAEEGRDWARFAAHPPVARTVALWRLLFGAGNRLIGGHLDVEEWWPESLGARPEAAAFPWLEARPTAAWLADADAHARATREGDGLDAPPADVVLAAHDKAFALEGARELGDEPRALRGLCSVLAPTDLSNAAATLARIESELAGWPAWTGGRFTLKPRLGSSGRGRVAGERDRFDADAIRGALPRLAARGGALLEPWLERTRDLSVVLHLADPAPRGAPELTILGSLEQLVSDSGGYLGHFGEIDSRGRVFSGSAEDEPMRAAAAALAGRARGAGYAGPCGVDGFVFRLQEPGDPAPREVLRPIVELNARFTLGIVVVGLIRRALARVKASLGLSPGERIAFLFALECPAAWTSWEQAMGQLGERALRLPLAPESDPRGPSLLFAADLARLRAALGAEPG